MYLERIESFIDRFMSETGCPGLATVAVDRYGIERVIVRGVSNLGSGTLITPDSLFQIASITKTFTAIAVLQQWEAGKIDLEAPVVTYLPWFPVQSEPPITVHHLLCHSAGIEVGSNSITSTRYQVAAMKAVRPPGSVFSYSNAGYDALGCILEAVTGRTYRQVIQEGILDPLVMDATEPIITMDTYRRLATGYRNLYDDRPRQASHPWIHASAEPFEEPCGCIASTVVDLGRFIWMLLNDGRGPNGPLISEEGFHRMIRPSAVSGPKSSYGYGVYILERGGDTWIYHGGGASGYRSLYLIDRSHGVGVVVMANARLEISPVGIFAIRCLISSIEGREPPDLPGAPVPKDQSVLSEYAGSYRSPSGKVIEVCSEKGTLTIDSFRLFGAGQDTFLVDHPSLGLFPFRFTRQNGVVAELSHGPDWYAGSRYSGPMHFEHPPIWRSYVGHYRASQNGTFNNFRIVLRKAQLLLIRPDGSEEILNPVSDGVFQTRGDSGFDGLVSFDTLIDTLALRARVYGCEFHRVSETFPGADSGKPPTQ